jgi:hypothetical protein
MKQSRAEAAPNVSSRIKTNVEIVIRPPYVSLRDGNRKSYHGLPGSPDKQPVAEDE